MTEETTMVTAENGNRVLKRSDLLRTWLRWICWAQRCYNYERLMGLGFCQAISAVIEKLFPEKEERAAALSRHMRFFNTENNWGAMILGATVALEEERAMGHSVTTDVNDSMKNALMGPLAGIGDSITQSIVKVILLGISIELATQGNVLGPVLYLLGFTVYALAVSYITFFSGYRMGRGAATKLLASSSTKSLTDALKIVSMIVIGALAAGNIKVLDSICPKLLPLGVLALVIYLLKKKRKSSVFILITLFVIGFALTFLNFLG